MVVIPASQIRLYEGLNIKPNQTYYFHSANEQYLFFDNLTPLAQFDNLTYVRDAVNTVLVPAPAHEIRTASYMRFRNTANSDKRVYYAYVESVEYVNQQCSRIVYTVDLLQSYMFKVNDGSATGAVARGWEIGESYIVRAHTDSDIAKVTSEKNTLSYVNVRTESPSIAIRNVVGTIKRTTRDLYFGRDTRVAFLCNAKYVYDAETGRAFAEPIDTGEMYAGHYSPALMYYGFQPQVPDGNMGLYGMRQFIEVMGSHIVDAYTYPHEFQLSDVDESTPYPYRTWDTYDYEGVATTATVFETYSSAQFVDGVEQAFSLSLDFTTALRNPSFPYTTKTGRYTPKSNKLKRYPFTRLVCKCSNGASMVFDPAFFAGQVSPQFKADMFTYPRPSVRLRPVYKDNIASSPIMDGGLVLNDFPSTPWATDALTEYLRSNSNSMQTSIQNALNSNLVSTLTGTAGGVAVGALAKNPSPVGIATSAVVGTVGGFVNSAVNIYNQVQTQKALEADLRNTPDNVQNYNIAPSVAYSSQYAGFEFSIETISGEVAEIIDSYLTRYGYAYGCVDIPVLDAMTNYTFIQTAGANVLNHALPIEAEAEIQSIFDGGITLWNPEADIGDYTVTNETR